MPQYRKVNEDFFKNWSREMAYILGFFMADGNLVVTKRNTYFISFYSADRLLLRRIMNSLESDHKLSKRSSDNSYRFQIGSKVMFGDLIALGITPNKSLRMRMPEVPREFAGDFARGYFDGDGNVWTGLRSGTKDRFIIQVAFTSGSVGFLKEFFSFLKQYGISKGSIGLIKNKNCGRLRLSISDSLKLYNIMYNVPHKLYLRRKKLVFGKFIKMRV